MPPVEVVVRLQKPWGIHQLLTGKWANRRKERVRSQAEQRLRSALSIVRMVETGAAVSTEDAAAMIEDLTRRVIETWKEKGKEQKRKDETGYTILKNRKMAKAAKRPPDSMAKRVKRRGRL